MYLIRLLLVAASFSLAASNVSAQGSQVAFGSIQENKDEPIEITSDSLEIDQNAGRAIFTDNVIIVQGDMRLTADKVIAIYDTETSDMTDVEAIGNVVFVSGEDAAESERADYSVEDRTIIMTGNVLVVQGPTAVTSDTMTVWLDDGTAQMSGRVRTVLQSGDN